MESTPSPTLLLAQQARLASHAMQTVTAVQKSAALASIAQILAERKGDILDANRIDLENAKQEVEAGRLSSSLFKRLDLAGPDGEKYASLLDGVKDVDNLPDPTARPEVVVQISCLALKSGNAVILKGGKEATHSNEALFRAIKEGLRASDLPPAAVQLVHGRNEVEELLAMDAYVDLVIPRGSKQLVFNERW
ncbi:Aldehyde/histidinol dehydrogenase [Blyttiomyces helicus]|uniref:Aldehyde/histidinol dehydrogenase n=1 Tax=Blyttiomyces helicus TaxID=388810 RepID=A0A4P9W9L3_9FUNG|nr:Aldehyde/histidinol dehydrogenase [Blyttiomyces helicus]|eukprot:RKO87500.1 Aldehyde/histidinol dehydrogenase [Blyttiomyces helicus]